MYKWWLLCACCALIAACADDDCSAEQRIAIEVAVVGTGHVDKITAERKREEKCGSFRDPNGEQLYTCWEQGAGVYTVRVYSGDEVRVAEVELEADECHIKERVAIEIDLDEAP